jgi:hypothetical protein
MRLTLSESGAGVIHKGFEESGNISQFLLVAVLDFLALCSVTMHLWQACAIKQESARMFSCKSF